jgi:hypothetical protein
VLSGIMSGTLPHPDVPEADLDQLAMAHHVLCWVLREDRPFEQVLASIQNFLRKVPETVQ